MNGREEIQGSMINNIYIFINERVEMQQSKVNEKQTSKTLKNSYRRREKKCKKA